MINKTFLAIILLALVIVLPTKPKAQDCQKHKSNFDYQEIKFQLIRNQVVFGVRINGKTFNMMLDTGGNPSLIDLEMGKELDWVNLNKWGYASGVGKEKIKIYLAKIESLEVGKIKYENISAVAMNLSKVSDKVGIKVSGILGYSFLKNKIIQINYPERKIRFFPAKKKFRKKFRIRENNEMYQKQILKFPTGKTIPILENVILDGKSVTATIDTGSSLDVDIKSYALDSLGIDKSKLNNNSKVYGASGEEKVSTVQIGSIKIGSISAKSPITASVITEEPKNQKEIWVNLGNGVLKELIITFDYINKTITLEKPSPKFCTYIHNLYYQTQQVLL